MANKEERRQENSSYQNIMKHELQLLLGESRLRGKILVNQIFGKQQLIVLAHIPTDDPNASSHEQISIRFRFSKQYPIQAPVVSLQSRLLPDIYWMNNILDSANWNSDKKVVDIVLRLLTNIQKEGLKQWIYRRFGKDSNIMFLHRHNKMAIQLIQNIQPEILKFGSAFTLFRQVQKLNPLINNHNIRHQLTLSSNQNEKCKNQGDISNQNKKTSTSKVIHKKNKTDTKPMNKNANLPKFLIRIFIKYLDKFKDGYAKKHYDRLMAQCRKMKQWKKNDRRQHAFGLKHLIRFFNDVQDGLPTPDINRKVITGIISRYLLEQICQNSQIPQSHRVGYLIACKVYALRCRNPTLASRIQSK